MTRLLVSRAHWRCPQNRFTVRFLVLAGVTRTEPPRKRDHPVGMGLGDSRPGEWHRRLVISGYAPQSLCNATPSPSSNAKSIMYLGQ